VVQRHGALYAQEYGWDATFEALVARIVADYVETQDPGRHAAWIAELDGERAGCVFCVRGSDDRTATLRLLLVEPGARGHGLGRRLVDECVAFARTHGYAATELWTNDVLTAARRVYATAGFELTGREPHRSFGHDLVGLAIVVQGADHLPGEQHRLPAVARSSARHLPHAEHPVRPASDRRGTPLVGWLHHGFWVAGNGPTLPSVCAGNWCFS
jgi:GNAT superfamily N-acetyltransferase